MRNYRLVLIFIYLLFVLFNFYSDVDLARDIIPRIENLENEQLSPGEVKKMANDVFASNHLVMEKYLQYALAITPIVLTVTAILFGVFSYLKYREIINAAKEVKSENEDTIKKLKSTYEEEHQKIKDRANCLKRDVDDVRERNIKALETHENDIVFPATSPFPTQPSVFSPH